MYVVGAYYSFVYLFFSQAWQMPYLNCFIKHHIYNDWAANWYACLCKLWIWKEYYKALMNEENERERRENDGERVNLEVEKISKEEVRMNGKAVGPDEIPVEVGKCLGEIAQSSLRNCTTERWKVRGCRRSGETAFWYQFSRTRVTYRGIKLISHSMKLWERVVERRLRSELTFSEQQYGFMPGRSRH